MENRGNEQLLLYFAFDNNLPHSPDVCPQYNKMRYFYFPLLTNRTQYTIDTHTTLWSQNIHIQLDWPVPGDAWLPDMEVCVWSVMYKIVCDDGVMI